MFTRNFWEMMRVEAIASGINSGISQNILGYTASVKSMDATAFSYLMGGNVCGNTINDTNKVPILKSLWTPFQDWSSVVGSGNTAAEATDYELDADETSNFTSVTDVITFGVDSDGHLTATIQWSGMNNTANDITITEVGLVKTLYNATAASISSASSATAKACLIGRFVLTSPVTIAAGDSGTVLYSVTLF